MLLNDEYLINEINTIIDDYLQKNLEQHLKQNQVQDGGTNLLPPIDKSKRASLSKYGYKLSKSSLSRKRALKKAAKSRGVLRVLKRINLIRNYSKSKPLNYDKLSADVEFLKNEYAKKKLKRIKSKLKRKKSKLKNKK